MSTDVLAAIYMDWLDQMANRVLAGIPAPPAQDAARWFADFARDRCVVVLPADHPLRTAPFMHGALWELALATALREARIRRLSATEVDDDQLLEAQIAASVRAALAVLRES